MIDRDFKGVWIPREIWLSPDLSLLEKCLLVEIDSLDCGPRHCFKSNENLAEFMGCSVPTVTRAIKFLEVKGLVSVTLLKTPTGTVRTIKALIKMISSTNQNDETPTNQNDQHSNTVSSSSKKKESNTDPKHKHGEYGHVLLTYSELEKLKTSFPLDWQERIKTMDEGIELKGYKYKSHYLAILKWAERDKTKAAPLFDSTPTNVTAMSDRDRRMFELANRR